VKNMHFVQNFVENVAIKVYNKNFSSLMKGVNDIVNSCLFQFAEEGMDTESNVLMRVECIAL
jgi:hypothetical protein